MKTLSSSELWYSDHDHSLNPYTIPTKQQKFVNHCIDLAANPLYGKDYANWAVKNFAKLDPFQLSNLHALILQELKTRAANE